MRTPFLIAVAVLAALVLAVECNPAYVYIWDGGYDLTVHVTCPGPPPAAVGCMATGRREEAERIRARSHPPGAFGPGCFSAVADPFGGGPLTVHIGVSGRNSLSGREVERAQHRFLVVSAEWPDGRRVCEVAEIPDGRASKEVTVALP